MSKGSGVINLAVGIGCGIAAGCALGLLYAPQAGKRTRRQLTCAVRDRIETIASKAHSTTESLRKRAVRLTDEAMELLDHGQDAIDRGKAQAETLLEKTSQLYRMAGR